MYFRSSLSLWTDMYMDGIELNGGCYKSRLLGLQACRQGWCMDKALGTGAPLHKSTLSRSRSGRGPCVAAIDLA